MRKEVQISEERVWEEGLIDQINDGKAKRIRLFEDSSWGRLRDSK